MKPQAAIIAYVDPVSNTYYVLDFDIVKAEEHSLSAQVTTHPVQEGANITDHVRPNLRHVSLKIRITDSPINQVTLGASPGPLMGSYGPVSIAGSTSKLASYASITGGYPPLTVPSQVPILAGLSVPTLGFPRPFVEAKTTGGETITVPVQLSANALKTPPMDRVKRMWNAWARLCLEGIPVEVNSDLYQYPRMLITSVSAPRDGTNGLEISIDLQELRTARTSKTFVNLKAAKPKEKRAEKPAFQGKKGTPIRLKTKTSLAHSTQTASLRGPV
jgi:hypothetical protein